MTVGILALQGDFREHEEMLGRIGAPSLLVLYNLLEPICERGRHGMPIWGTCAGAILLAKRIAEGRPAGQPALSLMDITARRNAFGRQLESFEVKLAIDALGDEIGRAHV